MALKPGEFRSALGQHEDWQTAVRDCVAALGDTAGGNLGFVYANDRFAGEAGAIALALAEQTGIATWTGTVGIGVIGSGREVFDQPALSVLVGRLPEEGFLPFGPLGGDVGRLRTAAGPWLARNPPQMGIVHADPRSPAVPGLIPDLADLAGGYLAGGLSSSHGDTALIGGGAGETADGGVNGVLIARSVGVATAMSQGCSPVGPGRIITESEDNIVKQIDERPALEVFKEVIGPDLAKDLRRLGGTIFVGLPVPGSDTNDYRVRSIMAIDPARGWLVVGDAVTTGQPILFVRRDRDGATADLARMLNRLSRRLGEPPKAALYVSCVARGPYLFGPAGKEIGMITAALGPIPIAGFFANGEIARDQLYGYTGVLTVFL